MLTSEPRRSMLAALEFVAPGHYFSALPSAEDRVRFLANGPSSTNLLAINENKEQQFELLEEIKAFYPECPFPETQLPEYRYYYQNPGYSYCDAITLYSMIRRFRPQRIIEVGSGYSSCVMMDTNDLFFNSQIDITYIEPYPDLLKSLMSEKDESQYSVISQKLQDVDINIFQSLRAGDILFIDSTHVSKLQSDVNKIIFEILPSLNTGVLIHFHDIFWPFEYPDMVINARKAWNEAYILRAFLEYNRAFEITFFATYMTSQHADWFKTNMPLCLKNTGGNLWIRKIEN